MKMAKKPEIHKLMNMSELLRRLVIAFKIYWKAIFVIAYPLVLLPVFLVNNIVEMRCLFVVLLMAGFWVLEILPLPITSLIPMVLFPLMGILPSDKTSLCYLKETNMMFVGGLIIAIAVEHCNLHTRVALHCIKLVGCSPRRLNLGLVTVTMFVSMWISNTAATAMMIPIIEATLKELEEQGIGSIYEEDEGALIKSDDPEKVKEAQELEPKKPTKTTMCYMISTAFAASVGGNGCIVGSGTNLTFKGIYETAFPDSPGVEFAKWMMANVPLMLVMNYLIWIWLQYWFMGLFRPNSEDAKKIKIGEQGEAVAKKVIVQKLDELGPMTFHEKAVGLCFCLAIMLWFFRKPQFIAGWAELITNTTVKDATAAFMVVMLFFTIPARPDFIYCLSSDENKRPKAPSPALLTWKVVQQKLPWGLVFLLGGGFALAEGANNSGMSALIAHYLKGVANWPNLLIMVIASCMACFLTQFSSNVACANVVLPVLAQISKVAKVHPMYLMMPATLSCSFSYCLPVSTPANALAAAPYTFPTSEMVKAGLGAAVISLISLFSIFSLLAPLIWDTSVFPKWAE